MGCAVCWLSLHRVGLLTMGLSDEPGHSQQASNAWGGVEGAVGCAVCWLRLHRVGLLTMGLSDEPSHSQQASNAWTVV